MSIVCIKIRRNNFEDEEENLSWLFGDKLKIFIWS